MDKERTIAIYLRCSEQQTASQKQRRQQLFRPHCFSFAQKTCKTLELQSLNTLQHCRCRRMHTV